MRILPVGIVRASDDSCNNAVALGGEVPEVVRTHESAHPLRRGPNPLDPQLRPDFPVALTMKRRCFEHPADVAHQDLVRGRTDGPAAMPARAGPRCLPPRIGTRCFRHQLLLPRPYLLLTKPLRLDIQCQRAANVKIGWKYLYD